MSLLVETKRHVMPATNFYKYLTKIEILKIDLTNTWHYFYYSFSVSGRCRHQYYNTFYCNDFILYDSQSVL